MRSYILPFCLLLLAGCASGSDLPMCTETEAAEGAEEAYALGPGDAMRITVFRNPELSGEFEIDGQGSLALPLGGDVMARGRSVRQLEDEIETRFKDGGFLVNPQVSVQVLTYRPFYILGEVNNPGEYEYSDGMTVTNAIARAGGLTYRADEDDILIERGDCAVQARLSSRVLPGEVVRVYERFF